MSDYGAQDVKCPFYKSEKDKSIKCEGLLSVFCVHSFRGKQQKEKHERNFCKTNYRQCPHFKIINDKYPP